MLKIGELAKKSGLTKRTIDYYTGIGLLEVKETSASGYRYYSEDCLTIIQLIDFYKEKHLTLDEIKEKISSLTSACEAKKKQKMEDISFKVKELENELYELKQIIHTSDEKEEIKLIIDNIQSIAMLFGTL